MRFYTKTHTYYCGIDLHARWMYLCVLDQQGEVLLHRNLRACPEAFWKAIEPFRQDLVVAVECSFSWYWLADLCAQQRIEFVLGQALYRKAIHGGKAKNDKIDSHQIAVLLRGGMIPVAYVYPPQRRSTRDRLRRRTYFMRQRAERLTPVQHTHSPSNLPEIGQKIAYRANRSGVAERFPDPVVQTSIETDLAFIDFYDTRLSQLELFITRQGKGHDAHSFYLPRTVPGLGKILALTLLYEIHAIARFERVQEFVSYCRLVKCARQSAGKNYGTSGKKIGNVHLKWAFSEAAVLFLRNNPKGQQLLARLEKKHGKEKALTLLAHKLARAVYFILRREKAFDLTQFLTA